MSKQIQNMIIERVLVYCEQVKTGTKLVAQISFDRAYLKQVKDTIKSEQCKVIMVCADKWETALIYKYRFVRLILMESLLKDKENPTAFDIWVAGKLFGYSDFEIAKYLEGHGYIDVAF